MKHLACMYLQHQQVKKSGKQIRKGWKAMRRKLRPPRGKPIGQDLI